VKAIKLSPERIDLAELILVHMGEELDEGKVWVNYKEQASHCAL